MDVFYASKLLPSHLEMLRAEKQKLVAYLARVMAKELMLSAVGDKTLFNAYHSHHFICLECKAAGKGYGMRCAEGKPLWFKYQLESYCGD